MIDLSVDREVLVCGDDFLVSGRIGLVVAEPVPGTDKFICTLVQTNGLVGVLWLEFLGGQIPEARYTPPGVYSEGAGIPVRIAENAVEEMV